VAFGILPVSAIAQVPPAAAPQPTYPTQRPIEPAPAPAPPPGLLEELASGSPAQSAPGAGNGEAQGGAPLDADAQLPAVQQPWSPELVKYLSTSILLFGLGVMVIMGWLVVRRGITQGVLRLICVPLIVVAAVFLMVAGYDDQQLSPIVGLLGTIAGYLLGKTEPSPTSGEGASGGDGARAAVADEAKARERRGREPLS